MSKVTGSVPVQALIGATITLDPSTNGAIELDATVAGFRVNIDDGSLWIELSTGQRIPWPQGNNQPSFNL